jgi:hypothetical protein
MSVVEQATLGVEGPDAVIYLPASDGTNPLYIEVERSFASLAHTGYWLNISPWLVINEVRLWEDPAPLSGDGFHGAFVELAGPASATVNDPGASLAGCELRLLVDGALLRTIDLSLLDRALTPAGYYVLAHDDSVPGTGLDHIDAGLAFPIGSTGAHAVQLWCGGQLLDSVQLTGAAGLGGEGAPLSTPASPETTMGRGFRLDTGDNSRDFLPQLEASPWATNVSEVR